MSKEIRAYTFENVEIREKTDDNPAKIVGYAAKFEKLSGDLGYFREKIRKGAFKNTIKEADIRALFNHDPNYVLGRNKSGTLDLSEDDTGLRIEITPPDTQWASDLIKSMDRGDINQMSFGFRTVKDEWDISDKNNPIRTLVEVELFDVSPVTYPAYPDTEVGVRAVDIYNKAVQENRLPVECEKSLRNQERVSKLRKSQLELTKIQGGI